jgi:hypothetical protein
MTTKGYDQADGKTCCSAGVWSVFYLKGEGRDNCTAGS